MCGCCRCAALLAVGGGGGDVRAGEKLKRSAAEARILKLLVGGRLSKMSIFALVAKQVKSHPALIPLFIFIGGGATMSLLYLGRLALKNPDVSWDRKNNPEPWNKMEPNQQYKLFKVNMDYSKLSKDRPDF